MLSANIESILFIAARPMNVKKLAEICGVSKEDILKSLEELTEFYNKGERGVRIMHHGNDVQMTTAPDMAKMVQEFIKDETTGELTKPSLEALTIIAYRGPITKPELEQIRGVNCSLILRNLMMRGLVEMIGEPGEPQTTYRVTMDFLRFLGVSGVEELPDYGNLRSHENIVKILEISSSEGAMTEQDGGQTADEQVPGETATEPPVIEVQQ
jgi:segregation and condensation protein B